MTTKGQGYMNLQQRLKKIILMIIILGISFILSLIMSKEQGMNLLIPALFTLAVFLVSLSYRWIYLWNSCFFYQCFNDQFCIYISIF